MTLTLLLVILALVALVVEFIAKRPPYLAVAFVIVALLLPLIK